MDEQLKRVSLNLSEAIIEFWTNRVSSATPRFTANELRYFVNNKHFGTAPASADRVMRSLRSAGKVNYVLTNRAKSLYTAIPLETK